ncbi:MAG: hypothetical protein AAFX02_00590, partial [Pseudomonadota bacterium]
PEYSHLNTSAASAAEHAISAAPITAAAAANMVLSFLTMRLPQHQYETLSAFYNRHQAGFCSSRSPPIISTDFFISQNGEQYRQHRAVPELVIAS